MFREIRTSEKIRETIKEESGYKRIRPETDLSIEEAKKMCAEIWNQMILEAGGKPIL